MGLIRAHSPHVRWTEREVEIVKAHYETAALPALEAMLPGRHRRMIQCKANLLGLARPKHPKRTPDQTREAKRKHMAARRAADPIGARAYRNAYHAANREVRTAKMRDYAQRRFFWNREMHLRQGGRASARQLARLWKDQRGRCAITGRRLDRTAQLDHVQPRARGGSDAISNLRWTCEAANILKRDMTDAELIGICSEVMAWIGRRIALVSALDVQEATA